MKILVTGSQGFMGKHLRKRLDIEGIEYFSFDVSNTEEELKTYISECDFVVHLAGVMRPLSNEEFYNSNSNLTKKILDIIKSTGKPIPFLLASSTQATLDNDYGKTKKMCEDLVFNSGLPAYVYRFTNAFGKWGKPNYNSVASTFFYNIAHDLDIFIRDHDFVIHFIYVDDIVDTILDCIKGINRPSRDILYVSPVYDCTIGHLAELIKYFKSCIVSEKHLPIIKDDFELKVFTTFCDYFSDEGYTFNFAKDSRGSFEEIFKSKKYGQISINRSYPGILKGGHYHTYKNEIFQTVKGTCLTRLRKIETNVIDNYEMNTLSQNQVYIYPNYTHDIRNIGKDESVTLMWISEIYSEDTADTYKMDV